MGIEFRVELKLPAPEEVDAALRGFPYFARFEDEYAFYEYRVPSNMDSTRMPQVLVAIPEWGLYVCNNGREE